MIRKLLPALLLLGCAAEDPYLVVAPELPVETPPGPPRGIDPPLPIAPPTTPWDILNPGDLPDVRFVVAWSPWDCSGDVDGLLDPGTPEDPGLDLPEERDLWAACPTNYAIVDLFGQVVLELDLPDSWPEDEWLDSFSPIKLLPGGPGEFVAVAENWGGDFPAEPDGDGLEDEDSIDASQPDGFWQSLRWQAWSFDAYAATRQRIAAWEPGTSTVHMTQSGQRIDLGGPQGWMHAAVAPDDPDWLLFWSGDWSCDGPGLRNLIRVHRSDPLALGQTWEASQFLGEELTTTKDDLRPWTLSATLDEEGKAQYLFGVTDEHCASWEEVEAKIVGWTPEEDSRWEATVDPWTYPETTTFAGWNGGGALSVRQEVYSEPWNWSVHRPDGVLTGPLEADRVNHRPGPMLDPAAGTFVTISRDPSTWTDSLDVYHRGERVWTMDHLTFGLQDRKVVILDAIVLPLLPEE